MAAAAPAQSTCVEKPALFAMERPALAYDSVRERTVLHGSPYILNGTRWGETWEWDAVRWTRRSPRNSPGAVMGHAMVYDAARKRTVLFGGGASGTWEWDGEDWTLRSVSPPTRSGHGMAFDSVRARVVVFGGTPSGVSLDDTWEWDGTTWAQMAPATKPPRRADTALSFDPIRGRTVLFGGYGATGPLNDTWEWDGVTWSRVTPTGSGPTARYGHAMGIDPLFGGVLLFGGDSGTATLGDTWGWLGTSWYQISSTRSPSGRRFSALTFDSTRNCTVLLGGDALPLSLADTWERGGSNWFERANFSSPQTWVQGSYESMTLTYDEARGEVVFFGANRNTSSGVMPREETWTWDGERWNEKAPSGSPSRTRSSHVAYDSDRHVVWYVDATGEIWAWNGSTWSRIPTANSPGQLVTRALAYDRARQRLVMAGTRTPLSALETWLWDGAAWALLSTPIAPVMLSTYTMAYDRSRQRTVLGGTLPNTPNVLWEWDGVQWIKIISPMLPSACDAITYDSKRQRVVLATFLYARKIELWDWDGATCTQRPASGTPTLLHPFNHIAIVHDERLDRVVAFDGLRTWIVGATSPASATSFGTGCGGAIGIPRLSAFGVPTLGNTSFALDLLQAPASSPIAFLIAARPASIALPGGCTGYCDPSSVLATPGLLGNSGGFASLALPVAWNPAWIGLACCAQGAVLDPTATFGVGLTSRLTCTLGE